MRSEFEKLPSISVFLPSFKFNEAKNEYERSETFNQPEYTLGFFNGAWYAYQQSKVDELQAKLTQAYEDVDTFAEAYERECKFKAQLAKEKDELQKRVDAAQRLIESWNMTNLEKSTHFNDGYEEGCFNCARDLEQALKGDQYKEHRKKAEDAISSGAGLTKHRIEL